MSRLEGLEWIEGIEDGSGKAGAEVGEGVGNFRYKFVDFGVLVVC